MPTTEIVNTLVIEAGWIKIAASGSLAMGTLIVLTLLFLVARWMKKRA